MFTEFIPSDRPVAFLEIGIILLITFILGFLCGRIILAKVNRTVKSNPDTKTDFEERDIISEPTTIRATLTRERGGNLVEQQKVIAIPEEEEISKKQDTEEEE